MLPIPRRLRVLAAVVFAAIAASSCGNVTHPAAAVVGGVRISDGQLRATIPVFRFLAETQQAKCGQPESGEAESAACSRFALSELIQGQASSAYASSHDIAVSGGDVTNAVVPVEQQFGGHAALVKQLSSADVSFPQFTALVRTVLLIEKVARAVTPQVLPLRLRYRQEQSQFAVVHVAHILVTSRSLAARIAARATPASFGDLARKYSTDPGSASKGGDLGTNAVGSLDPTFVQAALSLRPGEISGPVHTQFGWHVIMLISVRVRSFEEARQDLITQFAAEGFTKWLARQSGSIDVNPRYGNFDPTTGRVRSVCSTSASTPCPSPSPTGGATPVPGGSSPPP